MKKFISILIFIALLGCLSVFAASGASGEPNVQQMRTEEVPDADAPQIVSQPQPTDFVFAGTDYKAPVYTVTVTVPETTLRAICTVSFQWYLDGKAAGKPVTVTAKEELTSKYTATALAGLSETGIHEIYCETFCNLNGEQKLNTSYPVNFIICNGVAENTVLTFSDVHRSFENITSALKIAMERNEGCIPGLVICTGDWVNGDYAGVEVGSELYTSTLVKYIDRIGALTGGINTVYVSGNHDSGKAATQANIDAGFDAAEDMTGIGRIYSSHAEKAETSSGEALDGVQVFGINYESLQTEAGYSYEAVLEPLEKFLSEVKAEHPDDLVILSTHAALHVLGIQKESNASEWGGEEEYNIDDSDKVVELLNAYAKDGMDILWLFGHNHSENEGEFILLPGNTLTATVNYTKRTWKNITIGFTYGQAGYIAEERNTYQDFSLLTWDEAKLERTALISLDGEELKGLSFAVARK